jgi:glycosyltransferase involved in cell wall biosynthesis
VGELTGGVGVYGQNLIRGLAALGVRLTVVTPTPDASPAGRVVPVRRHFGRGRWLPQAWSLARGLRQADEPFDLVHFTDARFAIFAPNRTTPIVGTMNDYFYAITGWLSGEGSYRIYEDWVRRHVYYNLTRSLERGCLSRLDGVLCISGAVADVLHERYRIPQSNLHVVPYGIAYGPTDVEPVPYDGPMILFAGGNFQRKGLHILIEASGRILDAFPAARFVVLGQSADRGLMERRCEETGVRRAFDFIGQVDYETLYRYYVAASVFTMPSLLEAFGIPYLEAMHCGVPVVASDVAGPDEYLRDQRNCLIAPAGNAAALADATIALLRDRQLVERLIEGGKETARAFTLQQMAAATLDVYRSVVA